MLRKSNTKSSKKPLQNDIQNTPTDFDDNQIYRAQVVEGQVIPVHQETPELIHANYSNTTNSLKRKYTESTEKEKSRKKAKVQAETDVVKVKKEPGMEQSEKLPVVKFNLKKFKEIAKRLRGERDDDAEHCCHLTEAFLEYLCTGKEPTGPIPKKPATFEHFTHYFYTEDIYAQVKKEPGLKTTQKKSSKVTQITHIEIDRDTDLGKRAPLGEDYPEEDGYINVDGPIVYDIERFNQPSALYSEINERLIKEAVLNGGRLCGIIDIGRCGKTVDDAIHLLVFVVETKPKVRIAFIDPQRKDKYLVVDDLTKIIPFYNPRKKQMDPFSERVFYTPITRWRKEEENIANSIVIETETQPVSEQTNELMQTEHQNLAFNSPIAKRLKQSKQNEIAETNNRVQQKLYLDSLPLHPNYRATPNINTQQNFMWDNLPNVFFKEGKIFEYSDKTMVDKKLLSYRKVKKVLRFDNTYDYFICGDGGKAVRILPIMWDNLPNVFLKTDNKGPKRMKYADETNVDEKIVFSPEGIKKVQKNPPGRGFDYYVRGGDGSAVTVFTAQYLASKIHQELKKERNASAELNVHLPESEGVLNRSVSPNKPYSNHPNLLFAQQPNNKNKIFYLAPSTNNDLCPFK